jgi:hypothetical protein
MWISMGSDPDGKIPEKHAGNLLEKRILRLFFPSRGLPTFVQPHGSPELLMVEERVPLDCFRKPLEDTALDFLELLRL